MLVTIIADASFCPETNVGGYGYWVASHRGKEGGGQPLKGEVVDNVVAEMMALCNALYHAIQSKLVEAGDEVLFQSDCTPAIDALTGKRQSFKEQELKVVEQFQRAKTQLNLVFRFKHVRGHTRIDDARHATNRACDRRARKAMRQARGLKQVDKLKELLQ